MNGYGVSQQSYDEQVARKAALKAEIERLSIRCDGYQASRDWAINQLAATLNVEADTGRAVEFYARLAAEEIIRLRAEVDSMADEIELKSAALTGTSKSMGAEIERLRDELAAVGNNLLSEIVKSDQLQKHLVACNAANVRLAIELAAAKAAIANIVVIEVEPLKALLREALENIDSEACNEDLCNRIRAALGDGL